MKAKLLSQKKFRKDVIEFTFELSEKAAWISGQFAMITIHDNKLPKIKRAYSIASSPTKSPRIVFLIKKVENGRGTKWFFKNLKINDIVDMDLPFGHMQLNSNNQDSEILLIGTGIGITPMFSMAEFLKESSFLKKTRLIFGSRFEDEIFYFEKMNKYATEFSNFEFYPTVSRPQKKGLINNNFPPAHIGRSNIILENIDINYSKQEVYLCGSLDVVQSLKKFLIEKGVKKDLIYTEIY